MLFCFNRHQVFLYSNKGAHEFCANGAMLCQLVSHCINSLFCPVFPVLSKFLRYALHKRRMQLSNTCRVALLMDVPRLSAVAVSPTTSESFFE